MMGYYDYILALIPVALAGVAGLLTLAGFSATLAIPAGGVAAGAVMYHAMFVSAPGDDDAGTPAADSRAPANAD